MKFVRWYVLLGMCAALGTSLIKSSADASSSTAQGQTLSSPDLQARRAKRREMAATLKQKLLAAQAALQTPQQATVNQPAPAPTQTVAPATGS